MEKASENQTFIIAEAGVNHNGKLELAREMIYQAREAGADAIKFQTFQTDLVISKDAPKAEYQVRETGAGESQKEMVKRLELSYEAFRELKKLADDIGILFLSTPFDTESIHFLESLGMTIWKIPSGEITNLPYLEQVAQTAKSVIMSTGMCEVQEIQAAVEILEKNGISRKDLTLLHCTTEYPAPLESVNLKAMAALREWFQCRVGYSDHTMGIEVPVAAAALGAKVIEKHFTLDRTMEGPDHKASLIPGELREMVCAIRNVELALGTGQKAPSPIELKNRLVARKSIVAKRAIRRGEILSEENLSVKRPGNGISPMEWYQVLGTAAVQDFQEDELITQ